MKSMRDHLRETAKLTPKAKFTPGPWKRECDINNNPTASELFIVTEKYYNEIADVNYGSGTGISFNQARANSKLIAAAPDLYNACRVAHIQLKLEIERRNKAGFSTPKGMQTAFLLTGDAIAKAEGK